MTDPWGTPDPNAQPAVPSYGQPGPSVDKPAYGTPPAGYEPPSAGWAEPAGGAVGTIRGTGVSILLIVVTFGIYSYVYNYKVHREMQRYSNRGIGGGVALLLTFVAGIAMPFVTPSEVGSLYSRRGTKAPVSGWTGLWVVLPAIGGYLAITIGIFVAAAAGSSTSDGADSGSISTGAGVAVIGVVVVGVALALAGAVTWFVKTNGALNRYWLSVGATR